MESGSGLLTSGARPRACETFFVSSIFVGRGFDGEIFSNSTCSLVTLIFSGPFPTTPSNCAIFSAATSCSALTAFNFHPFSRSYNSRNRWTSFFARVKYALSSSAFSSLASSSSRIGNSAISSDWRKRGGAGICFWMVEDVEADG